MRSSSGAVPGEGACHGLHSFQAGRRAFKVTQLLPASHDYLSPCSYGVTLKELVSQGWAAPLLQLQGPPCLDGPNALAASPQCGRFPPFAPCSKEIHWLEFGVGGGVSPTGDKKATTAEEAAFTPFFVSISF